MQPVFHVADGLLLSVMRPMGEDPAWNTLPQRRRLRTRSLICTAILALTVVVSGLVLSWASKPFWGESQPVDAVALSTREYHGGKRSWHCDVFLAFTLGTDKKTMRLEAQDRCRNLPEQGEPVTVLVDADGKGVRILGYDHYLHEMLGLVFYCVLLLGTPISRVMLWTLRRHRLVKRLTRAQPWHEVEGLVTGAWTHDGPESFVMELTDSLGTGCNLLIRCNGRRPEGLEPEEGSPIRLWLVADGKGNALVRAPGGHHWSLAKVSVPTGFELRALGF